MSEGGISIDAVAGGEFLISGSEDICRDIVVSLLFVVLVLVRVVLASAWVSDWGVDCTTRVH